MQYYLDIETEGTKPKEHKIISIQYQSVNNRGEPIGDLEILKEWESSEEDIIKKFYDIFMDDNVWLFIPILHNSIFDLTFLFEKFKKYKLPLKQTLAEFLYKKPVIDIKPILIMMNNLVFKGSGLNNMTNKEGSGDEVPEWYEDKEYNKIEDYIKMEAKAFLEFLQKLMIELPKLRE